jgi:hypothetical protein
LLCKTPQILRDEDLIKYIGHGNKSVGTNATATTNVWARRLIRDWLLSPAYSQRNNESEDNVNLKLNLHTIRGKALLEELLKWNPDGNFDRVSALGMVMILREERLKNLESNMSDDNSNIKAKDDYFLKNYDYRFNKNMDITKYF